MRKGLKYKYKYKYSYMCTYCTQVQVLIYVYLLYLSTSTNVLGPMPDTCRYNTNKSVVTFIIYYGFIFRHMDTQGSTDVSLNSTEERYQTDQYSVHYKIK